MKRTLMLATLAIAAITTTCSAQSIQYNAGTRTVTIYGTDYADEVYVENYNWFGEKIDIEIEYWDPVEGEWEDEDETFDADEVDTIIFYGYDGDDYFECEDDDDIEAVCELYGDDGFDVLIGGPNADYIDGGYDGEADVMVGGRGPDTFVRWYEWQFQRVPPPLPLLPLSFPLTIDAVNVWTPTPFASSFVRVYEYEDVQDFLAGEGDTYEDRWYY